MVYQWLALIAKPSITYNIIIIIIAILLDIVYISPGFGKSRELWMGLQQSKLTQCYTNLKEGKIESTYLQFLSN